MNVLPPWYIIGHAANAKMQMDRFPEGHPSRKKYELEYDALKRLSEQRIEINNIIVLKK